MRRNKKETNELVKTIERTRVQRGDLVKRKDLTLTFNKNWEVLGLGIVTHADVQGVKGPGPWCEVYFSNVDKHEIVHARQLEVVSKFKR